MTIEDLEKEKNRLEVEVQKTNFNVKEIPSLKKRLDELEEDNRRLINERDDLASQIKQSALAKNAGKATSERITYLEKQLEFHTQENKHLNNNLQKYLKDIDELTLINSQYESDLNSANNNTKLSERKIQDLEENVSRMKEERGSLLKELELLKEKIRKFTERFGNMEDIEASLKMYQQEVNEYKIQIDELSAFKEMAEAKIAEYEANMSQAADELQRLNNELMATGKENEGLALRVDRLDKELAEKNRLLREKDAEIQALKDELAKLKYNQSNSSSAMDNMKLKLSELISNLAIREDEARRLAEENDKLKNKSKLNEGQIMDLQAILDSRLKDAENDARNLRKVVVDLEKENANLKRKLADAETQLFQLNSVYTESKEELEQLRNKVRQQDKLLNDGDRTKKDLENTQKNLRDLEDEINRLRNKSAALEDQLVRANEAINGLNFQVTDKDEITKELQRIRIRITDLERDNKNLKDENENIPLMKEKIREKERLLAAANDKIAELDRALDNLEADKADLMNKLNDKTKEAETLKIKYMELQRRLNDKGILDEEIDRLNNELADATRALNDRTREKDELRMKFASLEGLPRQLEEAKNRAKAAENELNRLKGLKDDLQSQNDILNARIQDQERRLREITELKIKIEGLDSLKDDLERQLSNKNREAENWKNKYLTLERRLLDIDNLSNQINALQDKLFEREKELDRLLQEKGLLNNRVEMLREKERNLTKENERLSPFEPRAQTLELDNANLKNSLDERNQEVEDWKNRFMDAERRANSANSDDALRMLKEELDRLAMLMEQRTRERDAAKAHLIDLEHKLSELDDAKRQSDLLRGENERLGHMLADKSRDYEHLKTRIAELEGKLLAKAELENRLIQVKDDLKSAQVKNREIQNELELMKQRNHSSENKLKLLKKLEGEIDALKQSLLEKDRIIQGLLQEKETQLFLIKQLQERERSGDKLNDKLSQLELQCKNLMQRNNEIQSQMFMKEQELEDWRSRYYENEKKGSLVDELQNRVKILNEDLHKYEILLGDNQQDSDKIRRLNEEQEAMRVKLNATEDSKQALADENFKKDDLIKSLKEKLNNLEIRLKEFTSVKLEWEKMNAEGKTSDQIRFNLESRLVEAKRDLGNLSNERDDLRAKLANQSDIDAKLQSLLHDKEKLQELLNEKFKENESLRTKLTDAELKTMLLSEFEKKNQALKDEIADFSNHIEILKKENRTLKDRLDDYREKDRANAALNERLAELTVS